MKHEEGSRYGDDRMNTVIAFNPRAEVLGDHSDEIINTLIGYDGEVYRADNLDSIADIAAFYDQEEHLLRDPKGETGGSSWYDDSVLFDAEGLDSTDAQAILEGNTTFELVGAPLEDMARVVDSLDSEAHSRNRYVLNQDLAYDRWNPEEEDIPEFNSLNELSRNIPEIVQSRIQESGLDRDNVTLSD